MTPLLVAVAVVYSLLSQVLLVYGQYNNWLLRLALKYRKLPVPRPPPPTEWPSVTVQLPIYNEPEVVERLLRAVAALDYPRDRLQIQLLDDSTDGITPALGARVAEELRQEGTHIEEIRREVRTGYKAGALQEVMPLVRGEFVLLLDADFLPEPDLLKRLLPWFSDPKIGMVQGRWGTVTPPRTLVERSSVHWAERHFGIEQFARSRSGQFFHFNGSGGIWRKTAIEDAGGWSAQTLAEDLELSYRAWVKGWRFHYDDDTLVPSDPPPDMPALRIQQGRWSQGSFQVARRIVPQTGHLDLGERFRLFMHTTGYLFAPAVLALALFSGPAAWARGGMNVWAAFFAIDLFTGLFLLAMLAQIRYRWRMRGPRGGLLELETAMMGLGMSLLVLRRAVTGLTTPGGEFERTPKVAGKSRSKPLEMWPEMALAVAVGASAFMALLQGGIHLAILPLVTSLGFLMGIFQIIVASREAGEQKDPGSGGTAESVAFSQAETGLSLHP